MKFERSIDPMPASHMGKIEIPPKEDSGFQPFVDVPINVRAPGSAEQKTESISSYSLEYAFFADQRERMKRGEIPPLWDIVSKFEIPDFPNDDPALSPIAERLDTQRLQVDKGRQVLVEEFKQMFESGMSEHDVFKKILKYFFFDTTYHINRNGIVGIFAPEHDEPRMANCEGRAKGIAVILEGLGYDPAKEILMESFTDHVRCLVRGKDGKRLVMEGGSPTSWKPTDGTTVTPLNDVKRSFVGLPAESQEDFRLGKKRFHISSFGFIGRFFKIGNPDVQSLDYGWSERAYSSLPVELNTLKIPPMLEKLGFLLSSHAQSIMDGLGGRIPQFKTIMSNIRRAVPVVSAALFLGYGVDRTHAAYEGLKDMSPEAISTTIQEKTDIVESAVEEAMTAIEEAWEKLKGTSSSEDQLSPDKELVQESLEGQEKSIVSVQGQKALEIEFIDRLPVTLEEYWRTHFDLVDFIVREGDPGTGFLKDATGQVDRTRLTISPRESENVISQSFWEFLLRKMRDTKYGPGDYPFEMTVNFIVHSPETFSVADFEELKTLMSMTEKKDFWYSAPLYLSISVNGKEEYRIRNQFVMDREMIEKEKSYLRAIQRIVASDQDLVDSFKDFFSRSPNDEMRERLVVNYLQFFVATYLQDEPNLQDEQTIRQKLLNRFGTFHLSTVGKNGFTNSSHQIISPTKQERFYYNIKYRDLLNDDLAVEVGLLPKKP